jgi:hypothetical protein
MLVALPFSSTKIRFGKILVASVMLFAFGVCRRRSCFLLAISKSI